MPDTYALPKQLPVKPWLTPFKKQLLAAAICLLFAANTLYAQKSALPASSPEAQGVSSAGIDTFLNAVGRSHHEFHSFMFLRHGKVVAQGWWNPYGPTLKHSLYSLSKSFTSTAVGFAVTEKLLTVNDKVVSFFPGSLPDTIKPYLANLTVKDLLTMSVGQEPDPTSKIIPAKDDWIKAFLALPIAHKPGSQFLYNSMATFMLSSIVQKVTGQKVVDYLKPRLFDPLGITGIDWEINKQGINTGGWGLRLKTEDIAKMGQLYLQKGMWNGKQVLPKAWVEEATTFKIDQAPNAAQSKKDSSDWMQGYCYQFWRCRNNAYRGDGAFGQYMIVMPDQDAVIAVTAEVGNMQDEINLVWKYLLPAIQPQTLPANKPAEARLKTHLAALALPPLSSTVTGPGSLSKTFTVSQNSLNIKSISLNITDNICHLSIKKDSANYSIDFATGKWLPGKTELQGPAITAIAREDFSLLSPYKTEGSYEWLDANTLLLKVRYIESPHAEIITCHFNGDKLTAEVEYSYNYGGKKIGLQGELVK
ncbi:MAG TPA: serine hydrolase [Mucilaginibacter sp.]|nr:serine hydrolase [Mucilaginibacter sp.]